MLKRLTLIPLLGLSILASGCYSVRRLSEPTAQYSYVKIEANDTDDHRVLVRQLSPMLKVVTDAEIDSRGLSAQTLIVNVDGQHGFFASKAVAIVSAFGERRPLMIIVARHGIAYCGLLWTGVGSGIREIEGDMAKELSAYVAPSTNGP